MLLEKQLDHKLETSERNGFAKRTCLTEWSGEKKLRIKVMKD
jgi:hypothetical protein